MEEERKEVKEGEKKEEEKKKCTMNFKAWFKAISERLNLDRKHPVVSAWIAFGLGIVFMFGIMLLFTNGWRDMGAFCVMISLYHMWEWCFVAFFHRDELSGDSFLINHSVEWGCAWALAISEYLLGHWIWPDMKSRWFIMLPACLASLGLSANLLFTSLHL